MGSFDGRRIVVTGGASGIGLATATRLSAEGARVALWDVQDEKAHQAAAGIRGVPVVCDVGDPEAVSMAAQSTAETLGGVDGLLNAAGIFRIDGGIEDCTAETWEQVLRTNLTSVFLTSKSLLPHLRNSKRAAIVNIASLYGLRGLTDEAAYDASKGGVVNLTRQMALDLAPEGIRVNAVAPGEIFTPMTLVQLQDGETPESLKTRIGATVPMKRMGEPDEVAAVITFLLSDEASYVTGTILPIDGGLGAG